MEGLRKEGDGPFGNPEPMPLPYASEYTQVADSVSGEKVESRTRRNAESATEGSAEGL